MQGTDDKAFEILVTEHHRRLLAYALSLTHSTAAAKDLVQDALLTAYRRLDAFDPVRSFPAWVRGIIRFKYLNSVRDSRFEEPWSPQQLSALDRVHGCWDQAERYPGELFQALGHCLGKLPELLNLPVQLFYFRELSGEEVATRLSCTAPALRKRLERARAWLGACIEARLADTSEPEPESGTDTMDNGVAATGDGGPRGS
jgi:RNA polymerase sigma-70 factor (ECF subfamily)